MEFEKAYQLVELLVGIVDTVVFCSVLNFNLVESARSLKQGGMMRIALRLGKKLELNVEDCFIGVTQLSPSRFYILILSSNCKIFFNSQKIMAFSGKGPEFQPIRREKLVLSCF